MEKQGPAIVKLCGVKAVHIVLEHIQNMVSQDDDLRLQMIHPIEGDSFLRIFIKVMTELLVGFTCSLFRFAES